MAKNAQRQILVMAAIAVGLPVIVSCGSPNARPDGGSPPDDAAEADTGPAPPPVDAPTVDADPAACVPVNATPALDPAAAGIPAAGLVVWLRADVGVSANAAGAVCSWKNQVGSELFTPGAAAFLGNTRFASPRLVPDWMPGIPALQAQADQCVAVRSVAGIAPSSGRTFFAVTERVITTGRAQPLDQGLPTSDRLFVGIDQDTFATAGQRYGVYASEASYDSPFAITAGNRAVESLVVDNLTPGSTTTSVTHYFNNGSPGALMFRAGATTKVVDLSAMTTTYAACSEAATLLQPEALLYGRALSDAERQQVEHYLATRYGVTLP